jgi:hypothetical protein
MISQCFIGGMMPDLANRVQPPRTIIEIRPYRDKEDAIGYATARAKFGRGEIRVLNPDGSIQRTVPLRDRK